METEEVCGVTDPVRKRGRGEGGTAFGGGQAASSASPQGGLKGGGKNLGGKGVLAPDMTIGQGDHEQPLMLGVLQALRGLSTDVQELKGATYKQWEGPADWGYVTKSLEFRKDYGKACSEARGTGKKVGAVKNRLLMAMYLVHQADPQAQEVNKKKMEDLLGKLYRDGGGKLNITKVQEAAHLVKHIDVAAGRGKSYITIAMHDGVGAQVLEMLEAVWELQGQRQVDPPPPKPVMKELKDAERKARSALRGEV